MNPILASLLVSVAGAGIRIFIGVCKSKNIKKKFMWQYAFSTFVMAVVVGIAVGLIFGFSWILSFVFGYGGTDFVEGLYRGVIMKMPMGDR